MPGRMIARNTLLNLLGQGLPVLVGLVAMPAIVRGLGTERLGLLGLGWVVLGYFAILDLGMGRAATRFAAEALGRGAREEIAGILWSAIAVQAVLGLAGAGILATAAPVLAQRVLHVAPALANEAISTFRILAVAVPVVLVSASFRGGLEADRRFDLVNLVSAPGGALNFLIPLTGVLAGWQFTTILWWLVVARAGTMLAYLVLCVGRFPELRGRPRPTRAALRNLAGFGFWATLSNVVSPVLDQLDRFLLGAFAGLASVGRYTAPQEMVLRVRIVPTALAQSLFPEFSGANTDAGRTPRFYVLAIRLLAVALAPVTIVVVCLAPDLLRLWLGPAFGAESAQALQWLAVGVLFNAVAYIPMSYLHGINRPDLPAKFHVAELPGFLVLAWVLMPRWGAAGAGAGWAIRAAVDAILLLGAASRCGATRGERLWSPRMLLWGLITAAGLALGFVVSRGALAGMARGFAALGSAAAVFLVAWVGLLHADDRTRLVALTHPLRAWRSAP